VLLKDAPREELFSAVRAAARGESLLAGAVASRLMSELRTPPIDTPSEREIEVLVLVARRLTNRAVGRQPAISDATVKTHLVNLFSKLDVTDRTAAVTVAVERGLIRLGQWWCQVTPPSDRSGSASGRRGDQRARRSTRSTSRMVTDRGSRRIQPRAAKSASALLTVSREAPTSWASSS
jgi:DNA-binding CsgD family transcriptional regulator